MGPDLGIIDVVNWAAYIFPSLTDYGRVIVPIVFFGVSVIGIFSNVLPEPGDVYPVPDVEDLQISLKDQGRIVYSLTRISRFSTRVLNRFIRSKPYVWFYTVIKFCSNLVGHFKGGVTKYTFRQLSKPTEFKMNWDKHDDKADDIPK